MLKWRPNRNHDEVAHVYSKRRLFKDEQRNGKDLGPEQNPEVYHVWFQIFSMMLWLVRNACTKTKVTNDKNDKNHSEVAQVDYRSWAELGPE